jgi:hypothetical protein
MLVVSVESMLDVSVFIKVLLSVVVVVALSVEVVPVPSLLHATNEPAITAIAKNFFMLIVFCFCF